MAHKGISYALATRRDFNLNVQTYRGGLGREYICEWSGVGVPGGSHAPDITVICGPATDPSPTMLLWASVPTVRNGRSLVFELEFSLAGVPAGATRRVRVMDSLAGNIYEQRYGSDGVLFSSWSPQAGSQVLSFDPVVFPVLQLQPFPVVNPSPY